MAEKRRTKKTNNSTQFRAYWQQDWTTAVMCNGVNTFAKLIFMRIASFGERGCWMTNETLASEFNRTEDTVRRAITGLWKSEAIIVTGWDGHGRKIYAANHPRVKEELNRAFLEAKSRGKIETKEQYNDKIRPRQQPIKEVQKDKPKRIKGLSYYKSKNRQPQN